MGGSGGGRSDSQRLLITMFYVAHSIFHDSQPLCFLSPQQPSEVHSILVPIVKGRRGGPGFPGCSAGLLGD